MSGAKVIEFFKGVREQLQKVSWLKPKEAIKLAGVVIGFSVVLAILLGGFDALFSNLLKLVIER